MLDKEKLDGVVVATTTHARALICLHAMQAGLDVYAEKPLTLTIEEGQYLIRAEKAYGRVFQTGTQQRSIPINNFGSDLVKKGAIGRVHTVICPNFIGPEVRPEELPTEPTPPEMSWDMWCHQTDLIPYSTSLHPGLGKWGRWRDYDGGGLGWGVTGWGAHAFDQVQRALGTDDTDPEEVWPEGEGPDCPVTLRYPGGTLLKLSLPQGKGPGLGAIFVGEKGKIEINRNRVAGNPAELVHGAAAGGRPVRVGQHCGTAHPELGGLHANARKAAGPCGGRASDSGHLPLGQYLSRAGTSVKMGSRAGAVPGRRSGQRPAVPSATQRVRAARHCIMAGTIR